MEDEILINNVNIPKMDQVYNLLKSAVKIEVGPNKFGSGFFIKFKKNNGKIFYCLMTNQHVINQEIIEQKKKIKILYENEKKTLIIELDQEDRFIKYFEDSLQIDVTVVQILDMDNIEKDYFLEPNDDYKKGYQQFNDKTILVVQYPLGEQLSMSNGIIKYSENNTFAHTASTLHGSSGGPIVLEGSDKVLGIHKGGNNFEKENYGDFIGPVIDDIKKFERNGFGKDFYKNGDIKYMGNFINDKYDDDNGLFYYEEGYKDDIYYYEKGEYFNGKFKEGKKIEGKIYDKNIIMIIKMKIIRIVIRIMTIIILMKMIQIKMIKIIIVITQKKMIMIEEIKKKVILTLLKMKLLLEEMKIIIIIAIIILLIK